MNVSSNETLFFSVTKFNETANTVCFEAPPHIASDGFWGGQKSGRTPMKSFLPVFELQVLIIFAITQICNLLLKPLGLPSFISQIFAGVIIGSSIHVEQLRTYTKMLFPYGTQDVVSTVSSFGYVLFVFINGVQMDFSLITRTGKRAWSIGLIGIVVPLGLGFPSLISLRSELEKVYGGSKSKDVVVALVSNSVTSFAVIASLLNELQIQNSELGRLALSSALVSDIMTTIFTSISTVMLSVPNKEVILVCIISLFAFAILIPLLCRPVMFWIIKHTPEGRPVRTAYIYVIILLVFVSGWASVKINQDFVLGAFILGLSVPEGPPLGSALVKKLHFFATCFLLPIFVTTCVMRADFYLMDYSSTPAIVTGSVVFFTHLVKFMACFLPALYCNMPTTDALSLALILNTKGVVEIGLYCSLYDSKIITGLTYGVMMLSVTIIASIVQLSVKILYDPSRKYAGYQRRNIMNLKATSELRIVACIHKPNQITPITQVLDDLCCPTTQNPVIVDVLHLVELVGRSLPIFIPHRLQRRNSGKSFSDEVILAFDIYEHDNIDTVSVHTYTAISPPNLMYEDVCHLALDKVASIIILPFHQRWSSDGSVIESDDDKNIRALNCKVLEIAPCSVGILVTRAAAINSSSSSSTATRLALVYLGGRDDREALSLAKRAMRNRNIKLVVYRLVVRGGENNMAELEDNAVLRDVVDIGGMGNNVSYQEIIANDGPQTAAFLRDIVKEHDFFVVGRRHGIISPQTEGLSEWSEFPELGAIGDFLASPDFQRHASVLVVQQQVSVSNYKVDDNTHLFL